MKKKPLFAALAAVTIYILLLIVLVLSERMYPESSIQSFGDAIWYSLVTLSTVGYGDLYPLSLPGRVIGLIFVLLSVGLLAAVIGMLMVLVRERLIPWLYVAFAEGKQWNVFSEKNEAAIVLAEDIARQEADSRFVFCRTEDSGEPVGALPASRCIFLTDDVVSVMARRGARNKPDRVFLISESALVNYRNAQHLEGRQDELYIRGSETDRFPAASFFDDAECCARQYWSAYPVGEEQHVLIAGDGKLAQAIAAQAILCGCQVPFHCCRYSLIGDWTDFRNRHPELTQVFGINAPSEEHDELYFVEGTWHSDPERIRTADRIIFCADDPAVNAARAVELSTYFAFDGQCYSAGTDGCVPGISFGSLEALFTCDLVMKQALDTRARGLHEAYCQSVQDETHPWSGLSPFTKASNRAAADHLAAKIRILLPDRNTVRITPELCREAAKRYADLSPAERTMTQYNEHERWMRFHAFYNWRYAERRDNAHRLHPDMVPFEALTEEEKAKDDNAWKQIGELGNNEGER